MDTKTNCDDHDYLGIAGLTRVKLRAALDEYGAEADARPHAEWRELAVWEARKVRRMARTACRHADRKTQGLDLAALDKHANRLEKVRGRKSYDRAHDRWSAYVASLYERKNGTRRLKHTPRVAAVASR